MITTVNTVTAKYSPSAKYLLLISSKPFPCPPVHQHCCKETAVRSRGHRDGCRTFHARVTAHRRHFANGAGIRTAPESNSADWGARRCWEQGSSFQPVLCVGSNPRATGSPAPTFPSQRHSMTSGLMRTPSSATRAFGLPPAKAGRKPGASGRHETCRVRVFGMGARGRQTWG